MVSATWRRSSKRRSFFHDRRQLRSTVSSRSSYKACSIRPMSPSSIRSTGPQCVPLGDRVPFLTTPRDVTRLLNALAVIFPSVRNEVNTVDFVAIEALRIFAPSAYEIVRANRSQFTGMLLSVDHVRNDLKQFHETWLSALGKDEARVRSLVFHLFPAVAAIVNGAKRVSPGDAMLRRTRRICAEQIFDVYFRYSPERGLSRTAFLEQYN